MLEEKPEYEETYQKVGFNAYWRTKASDLYKEKVDLSLRLRKAEDRLYTSQTLNFALAIALVSCLGWIWLWKS